MTARWNFKKFKKIVQEQGIPVTWYRNLDQEKNIPLNEGFRVDRKVYLLTIAPLKEGTPITVAEGTELCNKIRDMIVRLNTIYLATNFVAFIYQGVTVLYVILKGRHPKPETLLATLKPLGVVDVKEVLDPFYIGSDEKVVAIRVAKGNLRNPKAGPGTYLLGAITRRMGVINPDNDSYPLFFERPVVPLGYDLLFHAVRLSISVPKIRIFVNFQIRKVLASRASESAIEKRLKIYETDPNAKATVSSVKRSAYDSYLSTSAEARQNATQFEAGVMIIGPENITDNDMKAFLDNIGQAVTNTQRIVESVSSSRALRTSRLHYSLIDPYEAIKLYSTVGFLRGKVKLPKKVGKTFPDPLEYHKRGSITEKESIDVVPKTEWYIDRAISAEHASFLFQLFDRKTMTDLNISSNPGYLIWLPFYFTSCMRTIGELPDPRILRFARGKDAGLDNRFIVPTEKAYLELMDNANLAIFDKDKKDQTEYVYVGPYANKLDDPVIPVSEDGKPLVRPGYVVRNFKADDLVDIGRYSKGDEPMTPAFVYQNSHKVGGFFFRKDQGIRVMVSAGSGSGKSTILASVIVNSSDWVTSFAVDENMDLLSKVLTLLLDRYNNDWSKVLDKIEIVMPGDDTHASFYTMNLLRILDSNINQSTIWPFISTIGERRREQKYGQEYMGAKIEQYASLAVKCAYKMDSKLRTTLSDAIFMLENPRKGAEMLLPYTKGQGEYDPDFTSLRNILLAQAQRPTDDLSSSIRFLRDIAGSDYLKRVFCDRDAHFDYKQFMRPDKHKIVIIYAPEQIVQKDNSDMIASAWITRLYELKKAVNIIENERFNGLLYRDGKVLFVLDEFQEYLNRDIVEILTQGRKQNVSIIVATQNILNLKYGNDFFWNAYKMNFNYQLWGDLKTEKDVEQSGLPGNKYDLINLFERSVNGKVGNFYLHSEVPETDSGIVTTMYNITTIPEKLVEFAINALDKKYEDLDKEDGLGRRRYLSQDDVNKMSMPVALDMNFNMTSVVFVCHFLNNMKDRVRMTDIIRYSLATIASANRLKSKMDEMAKAGISINFDYDRLFPDIGELGVRDAVNEAMRMGYILGHTEQNREGTYSVTANGMQFLMESLGKGESGGGDAHKKAIIALMTNIAVGSMNGMRNSDDVKGLVHVYPNSGVRMGPDFIVDYSEQTAQSTEKLGGVLYVQGEVQLRFEKNRILEKIRKLPDGFGLVFYVPSGLLHQFRNFIDNIKPEELGKPIDIIKRIGVQSLRDSGVDERSLDIELPTANLFVNSGVAEIKDSGQKNEVKSYLNDWLKSSERTNIIKALAPIALDDNLKVGDYIKAKGLIENIYDRLIGNEITDLETLGLELTKVMDSFDKIESSEGKEFRDSVISICSKIGLTEFNDPKGAKFDENRHDVKGIEKGNPPNTIKAVFGKGYLLKGNVLKKQPVVITASEEEKEDQEGEGEGQEGVSVGLEDVETVKEQPVASADEKGNAIEEGEDVSELERFSSELTNALRSLEGKEFRDRMVAICDDLSSTIKKEKEKGQETIQLVELEDALSRFTVTLEKTEGKGFRDAIADIRDRMLKAIEDVKGKEGETEEDVMKRQRARMLATFNEFKEMLRAPIGSAFPKIGMFSMGEEEILKRLCFIESALYRDVPKGKVRGTLSDLSALKYKSMKEFLADVMEIDYNDKEKDLTKSEYRWLVKFFFYNYLKIMYGGWGFIGMPDDLYDLRVFLGTDKYSDEGDPNIEYTSIDPEASEGIYHVSPKAIKKSLICKKYFKTWPNPVMGLYIGEGSYIRGSAKIILNDLEKRQRLEYNVKNTGSVAGNAANVNVVKTGESIEKPPEKGFVTDPEVEKYKQLYGRLVNFYVQQNGNKILVVPKFDDSLTADEKVEIIVRTILRVTLLFYENSDVTIKEYIEKGGRVFIDLVNLRKIIWKAIPEWFRSKFYSDKIDGFFDVASFVIHLSPEEEKEYESFTGRNIVTIRMIEPSKLGIEKILYSPVWMNATSFLPPLSLVFISLNETISHFKNSQN